MTLHEYIPQAIDALEERTHPHSRFRKQDDLFDVLVDLIAHESRLEPQELRITEEEYRDKIRNIVREISESEDPLSDFHDHLDKVEDEIEDEYREFTILFPWNFRSTGLSEFKTPVNICDLSFKRIPDGEWERFEEIAKEESRFDEFLEELPTQRHHSSPFAYHRYWKVEYEAASQRFAINQITSILEILMGEILFSAFFRKNPTVHRETHWKYGLSTLQDPLCYLVIVEDEYRTYFTSYDFTPRRKFSTTSVSKDTFNELFPKLPTFDGDPDDIGEHLITAFKAYYSGTSGSRPTRRFLDYWRCLEAATLTKDEEYHSKDPLKRGRAVARPSAIEISDSRIKRLVDKRNSLVHGGEQVEIGEGDLAHLKTLSESSIWFLVNKRGEFTPDELEFFFEYGAKPERSILQSKAQREKYINKKKDEINNKKDEIRLLEQVIEWLDIEED